MEFINKILQGDSLEVLKRLPDQSVNMCVTSPPYYGLRDYQTSIWEGGDDKCIHRVGVRSGNDNTRCKLCGAIRIDSQIGLESVPEEYIQKLVALFSEVKRVLKDDGTLWVNIGDSYCGYKGDNYENRKKSKVPSGHNIGTPHTSGVKNKDLIGIPWMLAFALRADGWYLRQDIIWKKPNPMPESVTDRCTKSHEYIFLLSKRPRYYFDAKSIREPGKNPQDDFRRIMQQKSENKSNPDELRSGLRPRGSDRPHSGFNSTWDALSKDEQQAFGANKRSVWDVATKPYREAHFATFPEELIIPCILAGCPVDGVVLDPFMGAGTTALVALKNHRKFVGIELNPEYIKLSEDRIQLWKYDDSRF